MVLTTYLHLAAELRMGRAMRLPPLNACLACSRTAVIIFLCKEKQMKVKTNNLLIKPMLKLHCFLIQQ